MIDNALAVHPVGTVVIISALLFLIGLFELKVGKSRNGAYLTWAVAGISLAAFLILNFWGS